MPDTISANGQRGDSALSRGAGNEEKKEPASNAGEINERGDGQEWVIFFGGGSLGG